MLSDPLSVTYNSVAKSLPRVGSDAGGSSYVTADGEFEVVISSSQSGTQTTVSIQLNRVLPDATPSDAFDAYRTIRNGFGLTYTYDTKTRGQVSTDIPLLRTALLAFVDSTLQGRLIAGEK